MRFTQPWSFQLHPAVTPPSPCGQFHTHILCCPSLSPQGNRAARHYAERMGWPGHRCGAGAGQRTAHWACPARLAVPPLQRSGPPRRCRHYRHGSLLRWAGEVWESVCARDHGLGFRVKAMHMVVLALPPWVYCGGLGRCGKACVPPFVTIPCPSSPFPTCFPFLIYRQAHLHRALLR